MYTLDLWDLVPASTTIDYGDGDPVMVPAGALAGTIAALHAQIVNGKPTIVICRVSTGALDLSAPDARKFPGFEANPPDNPDPPEPGSAIGWSTSTGERYLDVRTATRDAWAPLMFKRFDLAKQIGCDGVDPYRNDVPASNSGFQLDEPGLISQLSWYERVATEAHTLARELSVGMHGGYTITGFPDQLADNFDWLMIERCGENLDCDFAKPFISAEKAVFAIDYDTDFEGTPQSTTAICMEQVNSQLNDGLIKDAALSNTLRMQCVP
jgi:hypothetical protein